MPNPATSREGNDGDQDSHARSESMHRFSHPHPQDDGRKKNQPPHKGNGKQDRPNDTIQSQRDLKMIKRVSERQMCTHGRDGYAVVGVKEHERAQDCCKPNCQPITHPGGRDATCAITCVQAGSTPPDPDHSPTSASIFPAFSDADLVSLQACDPAIHRMICFLSDTSSAYIP
ncbi:hypothetical protein MHYP_G00093800 [Metynnis hypsauchen]